MLRRLHLRLGCTYFLRIPAITEHECNQLGRDISALPVRLGGLGLGNPSREATRAYTSLVKVTVLLDERIVSQTHQLRDETLFKSLLLAVIKSQKEAELKIRADNIRETAPPKIKLVLDVTAEKGS